MTIITSERLAAAQDIINKMVEQTEVLFDDITETTKDRERLLRLVDQAERDLADSHERIRQQQARIDDLEAMLDSVRATVEVVKPHNNGNGMRGAPTAARRFTATPEFLRQVEEQTG